ncbi:AI-2E family transporter [Vibrio salinus]|uniref:AI-2E family transporter n=1 Tax=Vibrio salinus TaxID=2899784 RepID=UPI001E417725|nr:AI-2E family transporter [Vibrio salinus]MCE0493342.1 AI-2E family transporter [Vibrio salinus]
MSTPKISPSHWVIIVALLSAAVACFYLVEPYLNAIILAFILSLIIHPVHHIIDKKIESALGRSKNLSALISCVLLTVIIVIPLLFVISAIVQQGVRFSQNLYDWVSHGGIQTLFNHPWVQWAIHFSNDYLPFKHIDSTSIAQEVATASSQAGSKLVGTSAKILGDATAFILDFFLMLFVLFFLLRDYDSIIVSLRHILPLSRSQEDKLLDQIEKVAKSAVMGSFLTALAQGFAGGIGMAISGFPGLFWGTMIGFTSFIPIVGTALIWLPASVYLLLSGQTTWAIFLAVWSITVVGSIDNLLRPLLMKGSAGMNTLLIFFSLLGGIHLFGLIGLIYGPLIFAITIVLFNIYEVEFQHFLDDQDNS